MEFQFLFSPSPSSHQVPASSQGLVTLRYMPAGPLRAFQCWPREWTCSSLPGGPHGQRVSLALRRASPGASSCPCERTVKAWLLWPGALWGLRLALLYACPRDSCGPVLAAGPDPCRVLSLRPPPLSAPPCSTWDMGVSLTFIPRMAELRITGLWAPFLAFLSEKWGYKQ